jgi:hypothetical protein
MIFPRIPTNNATIVWGEPEHGLSRLLEERRFWARYLFVCGVRRWIRWEAGLSAIRHKYMRATEQYLAAGGEP